MRVDTIQLEQFRNYASFACSFDPNINVITGKNAQGKTNLLEALYYLAGARSFRTRKDAELIRFGENTAYIRAACLSFSRELEPVSYTHLFSRPSRFGMLPPSKLPLSVTP